MISDSLYRKDGISFKFLHGGEKGWGEYSKKSSKEWHRSCSLDSGRGAKSFKFKRVSHHGMGLRETSRSSRAVVRTGMEAEALIFVPQQSVAKGRNIEGRGDPEESSEKGLS